ncbi:octanoyltransferase LipM [Caldalkalibacillus thermarum]|uniref:lipoate--protein ligase family protein n=1 Tax=Caldalkalibacillus thermarum TaxID=296745 RepID=UPI00166DA6AF|nr:biotin/lipoate A/B protein ligase family protein [Caldalkalibacillus thermarum]GGK19460.1 octanoyltransferase LipM [Caldalkalibacillus thermarum]
MSGKETWRFLDTPSLDPATNMALDEAVLLLHGEGKVPPTIRFYTWQPPTLSIGYFQKVKKEINMEAVRRHGLGFVRRMTGGRAVLHDQELTYSVVVKENHPLIPSSVIEAYRVISTGLLLGFKRLGLDADFAVPHTEKEKEELRQPRSSVCFDSPSWYELLVEGRKVVGSAQTRQKGVVLQHGSILLDVDVELLFDVFKFGHERIKARLKKHFLRKAVAINQLRAVPVTMEEVKEAFKAGFAEAFQVELKEAEPSPEEKELAKILVREKYGNDKWNYSK